MVLPEDLASVGRESLLALVVDLQCQIAEVAASNPALRAEIEQCKCGGQWQAAPFSKAPICPSRSALDGSPALAPSITVRSSWSPSKVEWSPSKVEWSPSKVEMYG
jgi:hypothetical protein